MNYNLNKTQKIKNKRKKITFYLNNNKICSNNNLNTFFDFLVNLDIKLLLDKIPLKGNKVFRISDKPIQRIPHYVPHSPTKEKTYRKLTDKNGFTFFVYIHSNTEKKIKIAEKIAIALQQNFQYELQ